MRLLKLPPRLGEELRAALALIVLVALALILGALYLASIILAPSAPARP